MTNKKNKFFTFCFSLIPGAGEMYMGFYKMGISLMILFWLPIALTSFLYVAAFMFILPVIWFYSFFHVHNLNSMPEEEFYALEDNWLFLTGPRTDSVESWVKKHQKAIAVLMIFFGISTLFRILNDILYSTLRWINISENVYYIIRNATDSLPQIIIGIAIVYIGVLLIRDKKKDLDEGHDTIIPAPPYVTYKEILPEKKVSDPEEPEIK